MRTYRTCSSAETKTLGAVLAERILKKAASRGGTNGGANIVALRGELGAGKTTFTQGFLRALGARARVTSPTFVLMKRFPLGAAARKKGIANAYHIDAYRFRAPKEGAALGLKEIFEDPNALVLVEWPERLGRTMPRASARAASRTTTVRFRHGKRENERVIVVS